MMLSKFINTVFNFVSGRSLKRKIEKTEDEVLTVPMKRSKTDAEPDSTSSWTAMSDTPSSVTKQFEDLYDCRPMASVQQFVVNSTLESEKASGQKLTKRYGEPVKEVLITAGSNVGAMEMGQLSRNLVEGRKIKQKQGQSLMARKCIDLEGKEEYQRLINERSACPETLAFCDPYESSKTLSYQLDEKPLFRNGSSGYGTDRLRQRIDASSCILSKCVMMSEGCSVAPGLRNQHYVWSTSHASKLPSVNLKITSNPMLNEPHNCEGKENQLLSRNYISEDISAAMVDDKITDDSLQISSVVRSPFVCQWQNALQHSKYAQADFLTQISRSERSEEFLRKLKESETEVQLFKEKRYEQEEKLAKQVRRVLRVSRKTPVPIEESFLEFSSESEDEEKVDEVIGFTELSEDQEAAVDRMLISSNPDQVVVEGFKLQLTHRDILTLSGLNWLNDEVINFYMNLLMERGSQPGYPKVYSFNTFFYPKLMSGGHSSVKRWTKLVNLFSYDFILIPVHLGVHWCLAVVDFQRKLICYYDSMGSQNDKCLSAILKYLEHESLEKRKTEFDFNGWKLVTPKDIPQQMNGSDCGMFACKFAEFVTRNAAITFNQSHMPYFRRRMVLEIISKKLL